MKKVRIQYNAGVTLIELMAVVAIVGIAIVMAVPSFIDTIERKRMIQAAETLYNEIKFVHSEALRTQGNRQVAISAGTNWCFAISDGGGCNCNTANSCTFGGNSRVTSSTNYPNVTTTVTGLTTSGGNTYLEVTGTRGLVTNTGQVNFAINGMTLSVVINKAGHVSLCSNTIMDYDPC